MSAIAIVQNHVATSIPTRLELAQQLLSRLDAQRPSDWEALDYWQRRAVWWTRLQRVQRAIWRLESLQAVQ